MSVRPIRLRLSRAQGFDLQAHSRQTNGLAAVNCARPGPFGNPFVVGVDGTREECVNLFRMMLAGYFSLGHSPSIADQRGSHVTVFGRFDDLRGKNLACWCALDGKPCHCDVLLGIASEVRP